MTLKVSAIFASDPILKELADSLKAIPGVQFLPHTGKIEQLLGVLKMDKPEVVMIEFATGAGETEMSRIEAALLAAPDVHAILVSADRSIEFLTRAMRSGVRQVLPPPLTPSAVQQALRHAKGHAVAAAQTQTGGQVIAVVGSKGGAGATFLATNLAYALSRQGKRVAIVDLNMYFGDAGIFLGDTAAPSNVVELARQNLRLDHALLESSMGKVSDRLHILVAPESPEHVNEVFPTAIEKVIELARSRYDFVVLDVSPSLDALAIKALDMAGTIYLTLQLNLPFVRAARRMVDIFRELGYPNDKIHIVVNRCQKGGDIKLQDVEKTTQLSVARTLPNSHEAVTASINQGVPLLELAPRDPVAVALQEWAEALVPGDKRQEKTRTGGWWQGWTGR